jgi:type VI secretion system protein
MNGRGLLSRIGSPAGAHAVQAADAVIEHLRVLLNTRRGEAPTVPHYGVPDFSDVVHSFPGGIQALQKAIRETITEFEPRLKSVQVRHVPNDDDVLTLRFEITGRLAEGGRLLKLQTRVLAGGKINVD